MSNLYDEFENKYKFSYFSAGWADIVPPPIETVKESSEPMVQRKDLSALESELDMIKESIENIELKQLRLANLAKLYKL